MPSKLKDVVAGVASPLRTLSLPLSPSTESPCLPQCITRHRLLSQRVSEGLKPQALYDAIQLP